MQTKTSMTMSMTFFKIPTISLGKQCWLLCDLVLHPSSGQLVLKHVRGMPDIAYPVARIGATPALPVALHATTLQVTNI